ncbi:hypothetical protein EJB05_31810 [Eragrostis curvula]|uniref:SIAH-type domain-containing protein n=1 Tax=Eragrostis curvula TaxID=38414 RepID=A0A5J9UG63_9POAL|nr:hypothetical protein EJB05_31810 [Eragrostis curvula]
MERDGDASKRKGEAQPEDERRVKRLKGTMGADAFSCHLCTQPLRPPVFQCSMGHFFWCSSCCNDKHPSCELCAGSSSLQHNYGMDRAVESFLVDCRYADLGYQERTAYYEKESHEMACPCARCSCPFQDCDFAGRSAELLDHLTAHHKCPCTEFRFWSLFDLRVEPGVHVLLDKDEGQVLLVSTQLVE